jgi:hypothetical protein
MSSALESRGVLTANQFKETKLQRALTVDDVLATRAEYDHEISVRAIGPAIAIVLKREAPVRMEMLCSTESELGALKEECRSNPRWRALLDVYIGLKTAEEGSEESPLWRRENEHSIRLKVGQLITTDRVSGSSDLNEGENAA